MVCSNSKRLVMMLFSLPMHRVRSITHKQALFCHSPGRRARRSVSCTAPLSSSSSDSTASTRSSLSEQDKEYLSKALEYANLGFGNTYPNPAVGCVLVSQDANEILGSGFHPKAGFPHAEVFALLEAARKVESGVQAAQSIVADGADTDSIVKISEEYATRGGPESLFENLFSDTAVTAYVTLEPCCHYGKTPPCAATFALAQVNRVVVGFRDPNPRVDGGGVKMLQDAGIVVDMAENDDDIHKDCASIVDAFCKRITPKDYDSTEYSWVNGAMRSALRRKAAIQKSENTLTQVNWTGKVKASDEDDVDHLELDARWMERVDSLLWKDELVNLRLNKAVGKKKLASRLGDRIAQELGAHVAQTVGHTALLFRPGVPPILDLEELVKEARSDGNKDD